MLLTLAHQNYKAGNFKLALDHSKAVYERNPRRTDNLLLLGAVYYQVIICGNIDIVLMSYSFDFG